MTKRALASGERAYTVLVDNRTAVQNVSRFADFAGYDVAESAQGDVFRLALTKR